jgi:hypothetical protein
MLINKKVYGSLTTDKIDGILEKLKAEASQNAEVGMRPPAHRGLRLRPGGKSE